MPACSDGGYRSPARAVLPHEPGILDQPASDARSHKSPRGKRHRHRARRASARGLTWRSQRNPHSDCLLSGGREMTTSDDERAIRDLVDDWMAASKAGDTQKVLSLMADDILFT